MNRGTKLFRSDVDGRSASGSGIAYTFEINILYFMIDPDTDCDSDSDTGTGNHDNKPCFTGQAKSTFPGVVDYRKDPQ
jgi:hypothetical protein